MPYLIHKPGAPDQQVWELRSGLNTVGREQNNRIVIKDDKKTIGRHHAEITINGDSVIVKDLKSLNHTFVNNTEIDQCELKDGDLIRFGSVEFKFVHTLQELENEHEPDLSIVKRISPEQTRVVMQDLLRQDSPEERHSILQSYQQQDTDERQSVLRLRQQNADKRTLDKLKILLEVSKQLSSPEQSDKLLEKILDLLFEIMNVDRAVILMINEKTRQLECKAVKCRTEIPGNYPSYSRSITNLVRKTGDAILTKDASIDFSGSPTVILQEIRASMCVPIKPRAEVIGVLYADNLLMPNVFCEEDLEFLAGLANTAAIAIENANLYQKMQAEAVIRVKLERFFPQAVRQKINEEGELEIIDTEVTALFCDISRFTEISSKMQPRQVIQMLNEYFQVMVEDIVFRYEGTLEKYIGDALLAVWGAPYQKPDDVHRAVWAAIEMQWAVRCLNERDSFKFLPDGEQVKVHIGLNTGEVAAGNIGSEKLIQYATIGDTTNVTSRICSVAQADEILISQNTFDKLSDQSLPIEKMPLVEVKGKKGQPLQLYRVLWEQVKLSPNFYD